ncbi:MAG TPA: hypothetical protein VGU71_03530 [Candidatus Dormibacteraeota bacterium]|nr:hypothetical protein [Candidatus Dormibacteraeota bacterium]
MSESDFTRRLEARLQRGMASVPLPAAAPANARYRIATSQVGRRQVRRFTIAFAATGLALLTSLLVAAASGTSPAALASAAVHTIDVMVEQAAAVVTGKPAPTVPAHQTVADPTPSPSDDPTPSPSDDPTPSPSDDPTPSPSDSP